MPESAKTIDLDRRLSVLEERMNTITESYDRGWKLLEAKMGEDNAGSGKTAPNVTPRWQNVTLPTPGGLLA